MIQSLKHGREQKNKHEMAAIFVSACLEQELLNSCFPLDKRYAAVGGTHTKIDPDWPIAEVFIYESDYDPRMAWNKILETCASRSFRADCRVL